MNESVPSIDALLQQARAGDTQALNRLLDVYRNYLSLLARMDTLGQLQGRLDPSDLVQETLLRAVPGLLGLSRTIRAGNRRVATEDPGNEPGRPTQAAPLPEARRASGPVPGNGTERNEPASQSVLVRGDQQSQCPRAAA